MRGIRRVRLLILFSGIGLVLGLSSTPRSPAESPAEVRLGIVETLFRNYHKSAIEYVTVPLRTLVQTQTGLAGRLDSPVAPMTLAKQLQDKQVDLAIFHGFEFAWARQKHPQLQALLVVSNPQPFQAQLIVAKNRKFTAPGDLKGKGLALPRQTREHAYLFLQRRCVEPNTDLEKHFNGITRTVDAIDALDMVVDGSADAALIDRAQLEAYSKSEPENFTKLHVLVQSEVFPAGVIACCQGGLTEERLQRIRTGMTSAHKTTQGQDLLKLCRMNGFELPPADFDQTLQAIARAYPAPAPR